MDNMNNTNNSVYRNAPQNVSTYTTNAVQPNTAYWARNPVAEALNESAKLLPVATRMESALIPASFNIARLVA